MNREPSAIIAIINGERVRIGIDEIVMYKQRATPKAPIQYDDFSDPECPNCRCEYLQDWMQFCPECGQALNQSDKE